MKKYVIAIATTLFLIGTGMPSTSVAAPQKGAKANQVDCKATPKAAKCQAAKGKKPAVKKHKWKKKPQFKQLKQKQTTGATVPVKSIKTEPVKKCQFLFWEVDCASEQAFVASAVNESARPAHVNKGMKMVGLNARKDRTELKTYFAKKLDQSVDPARIPWCAAWANAVLAEAGVEGTDSLMARSFLQWGLPTARPKEGDVVVLTRGRNRLAGHVGFYVGTVERDGKRYIAVLGGNQRKSVNITYYSVDRVISYRTASA